MAQKKLLNLSQDYLIFALLIQILYYCFPDSDMVLHVDSDASYLSLSETRSRVGGHYYFSDLSQDPTKEPKIALKPNELVFTVCHIIRHIIASTAEAEIAVLFKRVK